MREFCKLRKVYIYTFCYVILSSHLQNLEKCNYKMRVRDNNPRISNKK